MAAHLPPLAKTHILRCEKSVPRQAMAKSSRARGLVPDHNGHSASLAPLRQPRLVRHCPARRQRSAFQKPFNCRVSRSIACIPPTCHFRVPPILSLPDIFEDGPLGLLLPCRDSKASRLLAPSEPQLPNRASERGYLAGVGTLSPITPSAVAGCI